MKITSERIGDSILITVEDPRRSVTFLMNLTQATKLGTTLIAQSCLGDDGLDAFRPTEREK